MKHYLDLIAISAGRHKKQTRMTRLCIVLAVFLVTVIFGMRWRTAQTKAGLQTESFTSILSGKNSLIFRRS